MTPEQRAAMELAREVLDHANSLIDGYYQPVESIGEAIAALDAVLEQPARQEPAATVTSETGNPNVSMSWWHEPALPVGTPLYTRPQAREPLTDVEIKELYGDDDNFRMTKKYVVAFARAIEAAHGIKGDA